jgi:polysaccharide pyruvyl transferase WcaK-like protein
MRYIAWLRQCGVKVVVTLHEGRDREIARQWVPAGIELFYTEDVDDLIARYEASRGVIGFRLHAALLGLGLGKPVIPVGVDWRGLAFIRTFRCEDLAIRPFRVGQFRKLRRLTRLLLEGDSRLVARLDFEKARFRRRHESFYRKAACTFFRGLCGQSRGQRGQDELPSVAPHIGMIATTVSTADQNALQRL